MSPYVERSSNPQKKKKKTGTYCDFPFQPLWMDWEVQKHALALREREKLLRCLRISSLIDATFIFVQSNKPQSRAFLTPNLPGNPVLPKSESPLLFYSFIPQESTSNTLPYSDRSDKERVYFSIPYLFKIFGS